MDGQIDIAGLEGQRLTLLVQYGDRKLIRVEMTLPRCPHEPEGFLDTCREELLDLANALDGWRKQGREVGDLRRLELPAA